MKSTRLSIWTLIFSGIFLSKIALARQEDHSDVISGKEERNSSIGIILGSTVPNTADALPAIAFGATLGTHLSPFLRLGLLVSYYGQRSQGAFLTLPAGTDLSSINVLPQILISLGSLFFGLDAGLSLRSWSGVQATLNGGGTSTTTFIFGPTLGFDYKFNRSFSLGLEIHELISGGSTDLAQFQGFFSVKIWI